MNATELRELLAIAEKEERNAEKAKLLEMRKANPLQYAYIVEVKPLARDRNWVAGNIPEEVKETITITQIVSNAAEVIQWYATNELKPKGMCYYRWHGHVYNFGGGYHLLIHPLEVNDEKWEEMKKGNLEGTLK